MIHRFVGLIGVLACLVRFGSRILLLRHVPLSQLTDTGQNGAEHDPLQIGSGVGERRGRGESLVLSALIIT